jgi:hypothetical protein
VGATLSAAEAAREGSANVEEIKLGDRVIEMRLPCLNVRSLGAERSKDLDAPQFPHDVIIET